jgi:hypothetical protein
LFYEICKSAEIKYLFPALDSEVTAADGDRQEEIFKAKAANLQNVLRNILFLSFLTFYWLAPTFYDGTKLFHVSCKCKICPAN